MTVMQSKDTELPSHLGNTWLKRIVKFYEILWHETYGTRYRANFGMIGKLYTPLMQDLNEWQVAALLIMHFDWHGGNGDDEFIHKRLESAMFPIQWVPTHLSEYSTYLTNALGVNFEDTSAVREFVRERIRNPHREAVHAGIVVLP